MESLQAYTVDIIIPSFLQMKKLRFRAISNMPKVTQLERKVVNSSLGHLTLKYKCFSLLNPGQEEDHWVQSEKVQVHLSFPVYWLCELGQVT